MTGKLQLKIRKTNLNYLCIFSKSDFQKAFSSLVHNKIIAKLSSYSLQYELLFWITEFLTGRMQKVLIHGVLSSPIDVFVMCSRVLIFYSFVNDITNCMNLSEVNPTLCSFFTDSLKIYCSYDSIYENSSIVNTIGNIEWKLV